MKTDEPNGRIPAEKPAVETRPAKAKKEANRLVGTFFRNGLRSNLDLTSLADTKAGILISINGFILTVTVTASSFIVHSSAMTYAFVAIILTSLVSIILAVFAVKPRCKEEIVAKPYIGEQYSVLYYQDMAALPPDEYVKRIKSVLKSARRTKEEMIHHLHILGAEIEKKYFWLKWAYITFSGGLLISALLIVNALLFVEKNAYYPMVKGEVFYKKGHFYNVFEPSGLAVLPDGRILIAEDENNGKVLKLVEFDPDGNVIELGNLYMPKKMRKFFKKVDDLEGATASGSDVFLTTSFSVDRHNREKTERQRLIWLEYEEGSVRKLHHYTALKTALTERFPKLFSPGLFFKSDMNIEGLAYDDDDEILWFGFRAPLAGSRALMIGLLNPREVIAGGAAPEFTAPLKLKLDGLGIRGLAYDRRRGGFWIVAGSSGDRQGSFSLFFYDKRQKRVRRIEEAPDIGFAEGIAIVHTHTAKPALFIVDDDGKRPNKAASYMIVDEGGL